MSEMHERLVEARRMAGYKTAKDATDALGLVYSTYKNHEDGHRPDAIRRDAAKYARLFKVDLVWLITGIGEPRPKRKGHPVAELFEEIPPAKQSAAIDYLKFLRDQG